MLDSLFTIVIPTHNRHDCLDRSIKYFSDSSIKIIYCDSTQIKYKGKIPKNITYYNNPKLKFSEKILFCLNKVKTPLVALSADDDFLEIDSLIKGSEFLNNKKLLELGWISKFSLNVGLSKIIKNFNK